MDGAAAVLADRRADRRGDGQEHLRARAWTPNVIGRPTNPHEPFPADPKILWIVGARPHRGELRQRHRHRQRRLHHAPAGGQDRHEADAHQLHHGLLARHGARCPPPTRPIARPSRRRSRASASRRRENARVIRIKNTLMLGEIEVSEAYLPDVAKRGDLTPLGDPGPLALRRGRSLAIALSPAATAARASRVAVGNGADRWAPMRRISPHDVLDDDRSCPQSPPRAWPLACRAASSRKTRRAWCSPPVPRAARGRPWPRPRRRSSRRSTPSSTCSWSPAPRS